MYSWEIRDKVKNEYITTNEIRNIMDDSLQVYRWQFDGMDSIYTYYILHTYDDGNIRFRIRNHDKR